eukprot:g6138.t1
MWEPGPFPKAAMKRVHRLEGNSVCMDCGQPETSWGGPTYGILLCVKCAGRHRSLGTHLTVIKSLTMDRWDAGQVRRMELGGNGQLRAWFNKCQTENSALEMKYRTKAATLYRENLRAAAEDDLASDAAGGAGWGGGEGSARSPERAPVSGKGKGKDKDKSKGRIFAAAERAAAETLARETAEAEAAAKKLRKRSKGSRSRRQQAKLDTTAVASPPTPSTYNHGAPAVAVGDATSAAVSEMTVGLGMAEQARRCGKDEEYEVVFGPGGMGFTLMKDAVSRALVTRLAPGGMAFRLGVRTGDYLVGVDGARLYDYDQLMLLLPRAPRPLRLLFEGAGAALAASPSSLSSSKPPAGRVSVSVSRKPGENRGRNVGDGDGGGDGNTSDSSSSSSRSSSSGSSGSSSDGSSSSSTSSGSSSSSDSGSDSSNSDDDMETARNRHPGKEVSGSNDQVPPGSPPAEGQGIETGGDEGAEPLQEGQRRVKAFVAEPKGAVTNGNGHAGVEIEDGAEAATMLPDERDGDNGGDSDRTTGPPAQDVDDGDGERDVRDAEAGAGAPSVAADDETHAETPAEVSQASPAEVQGAPLEKDDADGISGRAETAKRTAKRTVEAVATTAAVVVEPEDEDVGTGQTADVDVDVDVDVDHEHAAVSAEGRVVLVEPRIRAGIDKTEDDEVGQQGGGDGDGDDASNGAEPVSVSVPSITSKKKETKKSDMSVEKSKKQGVSLPSSTSSSSSGKTESGWSVGSKVTVQDKKKGSKWRKGLLRRMHGDGSWTVRYSGGMEERRVAASRMRLRDAQEHQAAVTPASPPVAAVTGTEPTRSPPSREAAGSAIGEHGLGLGLEDGRFRRRSQKGKRGKRKDKDKDKAKDKDSKHKAAAAGVNGKEQRRREAGDGGGGKEGASGRNGQGWDQPGSAPLAWAPADGMKGRQGQGQGEFRAPGELGDDFFGDSGSDSGSDSSGAAVSALKAYARLDPNTAATAVPRAFASPAAAAAPAPAPTYVAGYAVPRRMEGFGGGGRGWRGGGRGGGGSATRSVGAGTPSGPLSGSGSGSAQQPVQPREHTVVFPEGGMGLTLTKELDGGCSVTKVVPGGVAHSRGVALGHRVCAVNGQPSGTYEQTMAIISGSSRPISITFVLPNGSGSRFLGVGGGPPLVQQSWADVGLAATIGAMDAANAVAVEWGLGASTPGVLDEVQSSARGIPLPPQGFRVHQKHSLMAIPTGVAGGFGNSLAKHRTFAVDVLPDMPTMSTKKALSDAPGAEAGEFDVTFVEGELGMRLEERGSFEASSVVVRVTEDGQAMYLGVREGCTVVGINGEKYLSHAHTVATLKHAKRPVQVRFRAPEGGGGTRR